MRALAACVAVGALAAAMLLAALVAPARAAGPADDGQWGAVMPLGVAGTHQVVMSTGKVLFWKNSYQARVWDPVSGQTVDRPAPFPASSDFHCGAHVVLADGRVLVIGGGPSPHTGHTTTAVFDPQTEKWTRTADLNAPRWYPTATVLSDGRVLVGNGEFNRADVDSYEIYDPKADKWTLLPGADRNQDIYSRNYLLPDGRIFEGAPRATTWYLDLGTNRWTAGPTSGWRTNGYSESGAMYRPGKIIRSGGTIIPDDGSTDAANKRTGVIDMTVPSPRWEETAPMAFRRRRHNLVIMADGQVMAVGGTQQAQDITQSVFEGEIWNPDTKQWRTVAPMKQPRAYHSAAVLLPDGRILAAGGEPSDYTSGWEPASARTGEVYSPPYLFKGPRPVIAAAPSGAGYGQPITINSLEAATIESVALVRPGSVTHAIDFEQRYVPLSFTRSPGQLTATAPANGNVAPPGWYMLIIKNTTGVPSVAKWIRVGDGLVSEKLPPAIIPPATDPPAGGDTGPSGGGGGPSDGADGNPGGGGPDHQRQGSAVARIASLTAPRRITARATRRRGVPIAVRIEPWGDGGSRAITARLLRVRRGGRRQPVLTVTRTVTTPGTHSLTLPARRLRRVLRPGRYVLEVTLARLGGAKSVPAKRRIVVGR